MIKKVILHIGHDKTATCSIQDTFKHNCSILESYGYYYPLPDGHTHHNKLFITLFKENLGNNEDLLLTHEIDLSRIDNIRRAYKSWLTDKLLKTSATTIIFSGEYFPSFNESELKAIKTFFKKTLGDVEFGVYGYTRDPVAYASSAYQQRARLFPSDTKVIYFPYGNNISRYLKVFSRKSINLFKFEDACKYPKGPVCFLLNKMGLKDEIINRMQIHSDNESMSDTAVDLFTYINREIPYTESNQKKGLRKRFDGKHLISLPGRKFQLLEQDAEKIRHRTKGNMVWLKETFDINYSVDQKSPDTKRLEFDDNYVEKMIEVLPKLNCIIRKLIYDYINLRITQINHDLKSKNNLNVLVSHFNQNYYLMTKLSYTSLAYPQKVMVSVFNVLKRSKTLRRLKRRWIEKPLPIHQVE